MHITPDDIVAATTGAAIVLGAITVGIGKAVQLLRDLKTQMDTAQHELTHDHGSSMKDSSVRTEEKVDSLGAALHALETGLGGIRDEIRNNRRHADEEHESLRDELHELRGSADRTHRDLANRIDQITNPCTGWDHGDHVTPHTNQED